MNIPFQEDSYNELLAVGQAAASFIRKHFAKQDFEEEVKDYDNSLVSFVDREAEKIITDGLSVLFPDFGFMTEEGTIEQFDQQQYYWIIDPLDGTTNFIHGLEEFSVSIALSDHHHQLLWGAVIDVMKGDIYLAAKGRGSYKNNRRLHLSPTPLAKSLLATGFPYYRFEMKKEYLKHLEKFMGSCRGIRRCGSAALDMVRVASGIYGGFFEYDLHLWDVAAGALIIKEAGGLVTDFEGNNETWKKSGHIVAGNPLCHGEMLDRISNNNIAG